MDEDRRDDQTPTTVSRRAALRLGAGAAALAALAPELLAGCTDSGSSSLPAGGTGTTRPGSIPVTNPGQPLVQPTVKSSAAGVLSVDLTATPAVVDMGVGHEVRTWTFDGVVPGSTWELRPGDTLKVHLANALPAVGMDMPMDMTRPHHWSNTNLHTHGLHTSPVGNGDNIFVTIEPGGSFDYEIEVPADHPGGIFWYHPHVHGAVCQQVRAGMAGMLLVRGELDAVPEVAAAKEQVMVLQAIELGDDYSLLEPIPYPSVQQAFFPRKQTLYTVNGKMAPTVTMRPGEVQRWRLLNAAEGKFMSLALEGHQLHVMAWDGLTMHEVEPVDLVMMSAANRVDLLVKAGEPGTYQLLLTPGSSQQPNIPGMPHYEPRAPGAGGPSTTIQPSKELEVRPILTLVVEGDRHDMALPTTLPAYDPPILPIAKERTFEFTVARGPEEPPPGGQANEFLSFGIDGKPFDPSAPPYEARLNTAERWTLVNAKDPKLMDHAHSFHIHVNPFKVVAINGEQLAKPVWRDTIVLSGKTGDSVTFESNFVDFPGKFVEHCHVLSHEDLGMMQAVEVLDDQNNADLPKDPAAHG